MCITLYNRAEILTIIMLLFWSKRCLHKIILVYTDLYYWGDKNLHFCSSIYGLLMPYSTYLIFLGKLEVNH